MSAQTVESYAVRTPKSRRIKFPFGEATTAQGVLQVCELRMCESPYRLHSIIRARSPISGVPGRRIRMLVGPMSTPRCMRVERDWGIMGRKWRSKIRMGGEFFD